MTVLIDHMGQETSWTPGYDTMKTPRGIIDYSLSGHAQSDVTWRITGNLGGEAYADITRGPFNEGAMWAERQGFHLPAPPTGTWAAASPLDGIGAAGVGFYSGSFELDVPKGYDVPLSFVFTNDTSAPLDYRLQLYVNGWQFGKYSKISCFLSFPLFHSLGSLKVSSPSIHNISGLQATMLTRFGAVNNLGPQTKFPVPEGILDYSGTNYIAITLWAQDAAGAKLGGFQLEVDAVIQSGYKKPGLPWSDVWEERAGAY
jgi:beta-galactosidase